MFPSDCSCRVCAYFGQESEREAEEAEREALDVENDSREDDSVVVGS